MPFTQAIDAQEGGFYLGQQVNLAPANAESTFVLAYDVLPGEIPVDSDAVVALTTSPLVFPAPSNAELIVGLTINGVYTENFVYDRIAGTITVEI